MRGQRGEQVRADPLVTARALTLEDDPAAVMDGDEVPPPGIVHVVGREGPSSQPKAADLAPNQIGAKRMPGNTGGPRDPAKSLGGQIGARMKFARHGGASFAAAGRAAMERKIRDEIDPDRLLSEQEWARRYDAYQRAKLLRMSYQAKKARAIRKAAAEALAETDGRRADVNGEGTTIQ
jgi:hypothetical protein